jgi:DNA-binding transcriptional regulator YdaS (Cro superfamily)
MKSQQTSDPSTPSVSPANKYFPSGKKNTTQEVLAFTRGIQQRVAKNLGIHKSVVSRVANGKKKSVRISAALAAEIALLNQTVLSGNGARPSDPSTAHRSEVPSLSLDHLSLLRGLQSRVARKLGVHLNSVWKVVSGNLKSERISAALAAEIARINHEILSGNGARGLETRSRETKAQPATATPDTASCGANGEDSKPAPDRRADSPSSNKPRISLRCVDALFRDGAILASAVDAHGNIANSVAVQIGRARVEASGAKPRVSLHCYLACNNGDVYANCDGSYVVTKIGRDDELAKSVPPSRFIYPRGPLVPIELYRQAAAEAGARDLETASCQTTAQPAMAPQAAPVSRIASPARKRRNAVPQALPHTAMTASAVARRLQTSPQTVGRLIQDGKLKGYKLREGGQWHIFVSSVESLEAERIALCCAAAEAAS